MKKSLLAAILMLVSVITFAQQASTLPRVNVKSLNGTIVTTDSISNGDKPMIVSFWATWCKPCVNELNAISEVYTEWQEKTGVKVVAISIDDARTMNSVKPFVNGKAWPYEVYIDANSDFKRALNITNVPFTLILNGKREIIHQHTSYVPGDELKLLEEVIKLSAKE
ncbi:MAG: TlpA family protein disulfide reductase [Bacteroidetes bacterium]|nr:TlpA family protein disulfide reductase [Bacteroidota bacterium]